MKSLLGTVFLLGSIAACATTGDVTRLMDGRVVVGRFIQSDAYASFLRGAIAEEAGQLPAALEAFLAAASLDADDPETWSRIGAVRCKMLPNDHGADVAFARAMKADPSYGPLFEARAACESTRGAHRAALMSEGDAAHADPSAPLPQVMLARAESDRGSAGAARDRLVALTLAYRTNVAAWDALAAWALSHDDPILVARALGEVSRLAPHRRSELGARAVGLAGDGNLVAARALAALLLDVPRVEGGDRSSGGEGPAPARDPLVARLALDEALVRRDADAARSRATCAHLGLDVVAGRALLLGDAALARDLAEPLVLADPEATGARMVMAVVGARLGMEEAFAKAFSGIATDHSRLPRDSGRRKVAPEALLPFAKLVESQTSTEVARGWLEGFLPVVLLPGDALVTTLSVDLAALGLLSAAELPLDGRIELSARRAEPLPPVHDGEVDARHLLFARAVQSPIDYASTAGLARRLAPVAADDPLVAVALVRLSLAEGGVPNADALDRILMLDPANPILAAAALDLAKRSGDVRAIGPARARLTALARTPRERARALE
jgi:hypothetical protein